jgi:hypothetical protein
MAEAVAKVLWLVTKELYREEERRRRDAARQAKADRELTRLAHAGEWDLTLAVPHVLPEAIRKATGDGKYPVSAHTLFYSVRPLIQRYTSRELRSDYFEQALLPAYQRHKGAIPGLYYEPRGTLYEPHTSKEVPLGTREVEAYRFPVWLYDKILFIEKMGLWPVLKAAKLAERYDMAIVAGEGYATEACRVLFANAEKGQDYQLFVVHDADPHGYNIARTLREETERMPGHRVNVVDLGLKLEEALGMEPPLPLEEFTRKKALPQGLEFTARERECFEGRRAGKNSWICQRVELNALTGPDLIAYIERKLQEANVRGKVVPSPEALPALADEIYQEVFSEVVQEALAELLSIDGITDRLVDKLRDEIGLGDTAQWIQETHQAQVATSWRDAVRARVSKRLKKVSDLLEYHLLQEVAREVDAQR